MKGSAPNEPSVLSNVPSCGRLNVQTRGPYKRNTMTTAYRAKDRPGRITI